MYDNIYIYQIIYMYDNIYILYTYIYIYIYCMLIHLSRM